MIKRKNTRKNVMRKIRKRMIRRSFNHHSDKFLNISDEETIRRSSNSLPEKMVFDSPRPPPQHHRRSQRHHHQKTAQNRNFNPLQNATHHLDVARILGFGTSCVYNAFLALWVLGFKYSKDSEIRREKV